MNKKNWSNILSALGRTALAVIFVFGQTALAGQKQSTKEKPGANADAKGKQAAENPAAAATGKAQPAEDEAATVEKSSAEGNSRRGGSHEGIKVHGHWTIEVHNPDGALVRHIEFENSLDPGFVFHIPSPPAPQPQNVQVPGGAAYLAALLGGQPVQAPVWSIWLVGPSGLNNLINATGAACSQSSLPDSSSVQGVTFGVCAIGMPSLCTAAQPPAGQSCNLSVSALGAAPTFTAIQLSGSVVATQTGQVSTVATLVSACAAGATCPLSFASLTSSSNFPGAPIAVSAGQTLAVTVVISFS